MLNKIFRRDKIQVIEESNHLIAPVNGKIINIEDVEDEMFASKALGDGIAIDPSEEIIVAPANCKIVTASENMKHAIGLQLANNMEVLIHIGIDTVSMKGEGFELLTQEGSIVKEGTPLVKFNKEKILEMGYSSTVLMVVTNPAEINHLEYLREDIESSNKVVISW